MLDHLSALGFDAARSAELAALGDQLVPARVTRVDTAVMAAWIIIESTRFGIPAIVIVRMLLNAAVDFAVGLIPFVGDLVDFGFKGNRRNLELFHRHALDPDADTTGSTALVIGVLLVFVGIIWLIGVVLVRVLSTVVG